MVKNQCEVCGYVEDLEEKPIQKVGRNGRLVPDRVKICRDCQIELGLLNPLLKVKG